MIKISVLSIIIKKEKSIEHIELAVHVLCLLTGVLSSTLGFLLFLKYRLKEVFYYSLFLLSTNLTVGLTMLDTYAVSVLSFEPEFTVYVVYQFIFALFLFVINLTFNLFARNLIQTEPSFKNRILISIPLVWLIMAALSFAFSKNPGEVPAAAGYAMGLLLATLFFSLIFYGIKILFFALKKVSSDLKKALIVFSSIILIFIPFQIFLFFTSKNEDFIFLSRNFYNILINVSSVFFAARYFFLRTPSLIGPVKICESFINKYGISPREKEIIELSLGGLSVKEIAAKLYRSFKTVNNHIYNIYKKCRVKSKMELLNLIKETCR